MKKLFILFSVMTLRSFAQSPVYLNIGSHNETNDPLLYRTVYAAYELAKSLLLQVADSVEYYDARWNMQVDANFIRGCVAHDTSQTNPNNFLKWANDQTYIEVDPHNHFQPPFINPYNPTDLNHLLVDSCLLGTDRSNLGGFIWRDFTAMPPCGSVLNENWSQYNAGTEPGNKFPGENWRPQVIWGGGSPLHCDDANTLGIWKPTDATAANFYVHASGNYETVIGSNCGSQFAIFDTSDVTNVINDVVDVINYAQTYGNAATDFYTLTVMFNFRDIDSPNMVDKISEFIRTMETYEQQGKVVWATLTEKFNIWNGSHAANEFFIKQCDDMNLGTELIDISHMVSLYPNPTNDIVQIRFPYEYTNASYELIDLSGKVVHSGILNSHSISTNSIHNGLYFLMLTIDGNVAVKKIMVRH